MLTPISKGGDRMPSAMSTADLSRHLEHIDAGKSFSDDSSDSSNSNNSISRRAEDSPPRDLQHGDRSSMGEGGDGHRSQGEFSGEPEWQRAPGRWTKREEHLLREMKALVEEDLRAAPPFPEVVGSRRMLRFLRGHRHDVPKAAAMMRGMLKWRKENGVDAIREDIMQNQKFHPSQFPDGEMITRLFPLLVVSPLCVDVFGAPISYESYGFSPRKVTEHANGDLSFFIRFHIYCQEFKQICLDSLSDAKEMDNLSRKAAESTASSPTVIEPPHFLDSMTTNGGPRGGGGNAPGGADLAGNTNRGTRREDTGVARTSGGGGGRKVIKAGVAGSWEDSSVGGGAGSGGRAGGGGGGGGGVTEGVAVGGARSNGTQRWQQQQQGSITLGEEGSAAVTGRDASRMGGAAATGGERGKGVGDKGTGGGGVEEEKKIGDGEGVEGKEDDDEEEEPWGVVLRNTIIRDLAGFGMEHAGPIGRSLISKVLAVSQDNYPEMMEKCYIINAPWVFYALWKGVTPLVSPNTAGKIQVMNYDFLPTLLKTMSLDRLPESVGGTCDPNEVTDDQMIDFVVCGRVADVPVEESDGGGVDGGEQREGCDDGDLGAERSGGAREAGGVGRERKQGGGGGGGGGGGWTDHGLRNRRNTTGNNLVDGSSSGSRGGSGGRDSGNGSTRGKSVTFRNFLERLQTKDSLASASPARERDRVPLIHRGSVLVSQRLLELAGDVGVGNGGGGAASTTSGSAAGGHPHPQQQQDLRDGELPTPRSSPGRNRPIASPGPRGIRRASTGSGGGGLMFSPTRGSSDDQAEHFDSRVVDRALTLSLNRKARRFSLTLDEDESLDGDRGPLARSERSSAGSQDKDEKGGWAIKKWRGMKERRENKKLMEKGEHGDLQGISAGDCAEWVPNSERNSCLHCQRPFTLLLRRHHCRMCGELVCSHCSPHRVRLTIGGDGDGGSGGDGDGHDRAEGGTVAEKGAGEAEGGKEERTRRHGSSSRQSKHASGPTTLAVRVCTDCHFSLQTVNVTASSGSSDGRKRGNGDAANNGVVGVGGGVGDGDVHLDGGGSGSGGEGGGRSVALGLLGDSMRVLLAEGVDGGDCGGGSDGGGGGFENELEALHAPVGDVAGDVVLEDVVDWGRIQRRTDKCWEVVLMCLSTVIEMHHKQLLQRQ
eukprot:jgi/Undpi1/3687/HiC_scaffold_16.g07057.m1